MKTGKAKNSIGPHEIFEREYQQSKQGIISTRTHRTGILSQQSHTQVTNILKGVADAETFTRIGGAKAHRREQTTRREWI